MKQAILFRADGTQKKVHPINGKHFSLTELQNFVGGYIEICLAQNSTQVLIINEEGRLKSLPKNRRATKAVNGLYLWNKDDAIFGDALLCDKDLLEK
jgi:hypothetical protein